MSKMLEQVIVDAEALKEAALKNAEQTIIEKYSKEVREAVEVLLEQPMPEGDPMAAGMEMAPMAPPLVAPPSALVDEVPLSATEGEKLCPCPEEDEKVEILKEYEKEYGITNQSWHLLTGDKEKIYDKEKESNEQFNMQIEDGMISVNFKISVDDFSLGAFCLRSPPVSATLLEASPRLTIVSFGQEHPVRTLAAEVSLSIGYTNSLPGIGSPRFDELPV